MRRAEANALLIPEVPQGNARLLDLYLPGSITKRNRERRVELPNVWGARHFRYLAIEWPGHVRGMQPHLKRALQGLLVATEADSDGCTINGRRRRYRSLTPPDRGRLVATDDATRMLGIEPPAELTPLAIFPGQRMPGLRPSSWNLAFHTANDRVARLCAAAGLPEPRRIRPHDLRHTFAVQRLRDLIDLNRSVAEEQPEKYQRMRRRGVDEVGEVRELLGHISSITTDRYLREAWRHDPLHELKRESWGDVIIERSLGNG
jgi:integrase